MSEYVKACREGLLRHGLGVGYRLRIDINDAQSQLGDILMEMRERFSILPEP